MASNALTNLRGPDPSANRQTDAISRLVEPVCKAVMATPIMGAKPPAWIRPPFLNGFLDYSSAPVIFVQARYHRDALGYVHVQCSVRNPSGAPAYSVVFNLPPGYRANADMVITVVQNATPVAAVLRANGNLELVPAMLATDNIHAVFTFLAEQ